MDTTPNLDLPYLAAAQSQKHVTHNEALRAIDAVVQIGVLDRTATSPPASPVDGERHIVGAPASGGFVGQDGHIAAFQDGAWAFYEPKAGWLAYVAAEATLLVFSGTDWTPAGSGGGTASVNPTPLVGVNTTADTTNRLAVKSPATLFDNVGNGHQVKLNKASSGDTASLLMQTAYVGRAELGLAGDDNFHVKVSADGTTWREAIVIDRTSGAVSLPNSTLAGGTQVNADWNATTGVAQILNKPSLGTAATHATTDFDASGAATAAASAALATAIQRSNHTGTQAASTITGLATVATTGGYADLTGKPTLAASATTDTTNASNISSGTLAAARIADLGATYIATGLKGAASGVASLDSGAKVPVAQLPVAVASGASHAAGLVPDPGATAGAAKFLREDMSWQTPAGTGGVSGPATSVVGHVALFANTAGTQLSDGGALRDARRNRIRNGGMQISQENGSTAVTANGAYPADQWLQAFSASSAAVSMQQVTSATPGGSNNRIRATVTTAKATLAAGDYWSFAQKIEGQLVVDFRYGSASAKQAILKFGFKGPAGTYGVVDRNGGLTRSWLGTFTVAAGAANTDTAQSITIPGDTTGTWAIDSTTGLQVDIVLACGTTYQGAAGWQAGSYLSTASQSNGLASTSNVFELFDVSLHLDPDASGIAPAWELPDYSDELRRCQRYYESGKCFWQAATTTVATTNYGGTLSFATTKRAGATMSYTNASYSGASGLADQTSFVDASKGFAANYVVTNPGGYAAFTWIANARL